MTGRGSKSRRGSSEAGGGEQLLTLRGLAAYLKIPQRTVIKLANEGAIPGVRIANQWRFKRALIDAWIDDSVLGVRGATPTPAPGPESFSLADCLRPEHVIGRLASRTQMGALGELAALAKRLELVRDGTWFLGALVERENVLSSGIGHGVAFPHTLRRHPEQVRRPFILVGRSHEGIDFNALDHQPVRLMFALGLRHEELHLPWLVHLSRMLIDEGAREALLRAKDKAALYDKICELGRD